jgi:hypothetical protein
VRPDLLYFEGARERFRREVEVVARLKHPGIAGRCPRPRGSTRAST